MTIEELLYYKDYENYCYKNETRNIKKNISQKKYLASSFVICTQRPEISSLEITLSGKH